MKLRYSILFCFISVSLLFSQKEKRLNGQVIVPNATANHILVLNLSTSQETFTDADGKFSIAVNLDDLLVFQATHLDKMRKLIDEDAYNSSSLEIVMTSRIEELNEVTIANYNRLNAFNLGITATRIKTKTPAERGKYSNELQALEFEENITLIEQLENKFDPDFFNQLAIKKENIKAFLYFAVANENFKTVASENIISRTRFFLMTLAMDYNTIQKSTTNLDKR